MGEDEKNQNNLSLRACEISVRKSLELNRIHGQIIWTINIKKYNFKWIINRKKYLNLTHMKNTD